ncbi:MAG: amidase, partial [Rhodobacterales bacterium]|nr:amidase [Rhodobacterales bacterium]
MDFTKTDAMEISAGLAAGEITAEALMRATLACIAAVNPVVNAIVALRDADDLMAEARASDAARKAGNVAGWLHGIPIAIKDLANVAGLEASMGSPIFAGQIAEKDDIMVARLRGAGAIIIGKTNTPEFGLGSHTFNPVHGATLNPYDTTRSAGGSSGGAAVALATGMIAVADGSDMMGSLRNPAAWNNVFGFRPSWGMVPSEPAGDTFLHQMATAGPMARSPRDIAALLETMSGPDPRQPNSLKKQELVGDLDADIAGRRIGWLGDWGGAYPMEDGILQLGQAAMARFEALGCVVENVPAPFDATEIWQAWVTLRHWAIAGSSAPLLANPETAKLLKPEAIWEIEQGLKLSAMDVHKASVIRSRWFARAAEMFEDYDALALPSAQVWPFPVAWRYPETINGVAMDTYHRWMEVVIPVSILGLPCLNIPAGFGQDGLPGGVQLFGRRGDDQYVLQLGQAYHQVTQFPQKHALQIQGDLLK